ncbi:MAG: Holliday junction branch migration protein RuvA [FCB group bacterium]|jgi:Holliday junction DNA helicase RuvA
MIAQLNGKLLSKNSTEVVIDCGGVGYIANVSVNTSERLPEIGENVKIFTLLIPREDAMQLFGFWNEAEREAFKILISVSGVGPKIALGILSSVTVEDLQKYILSNNLNALQKLPGIGKKTAERLALELRDKVIKLGVYDTSGLEGVPNRIAQEALSALLTLGYSRLIADKAIRLALSEKDGDLNAELLIKKSLKYAMM